jgi:hypothetical protein
MSRAFFRALKRVHAPPAEPDPNARRKLEGELVTAFERRHPARPSRSPILRGAALTVAIVALAGATSRVPADLSLQVGERIEVTLSPGEPIPTAQPIAEAVGEGGRREIEVRVRRDASGQGMLSVDVWGDALPDPATLGQRLRALTAFHDARISVLPIEGHLHETLGAKLGYELLRFSPSRDAQARARQQLIDAIREREGRDAAVEVNVIDEGGRRRVEVRVEKHVQH